MHGGGMSQPAVTEFILKTLCSNQGSLDYNTVLEKVASRFGTSGADVNQVLYNTQHFAVVKGLGAAGTSMTPGSRVIAVTSVRMCKNYPKKDCEGCSKLHLCRRFVYDDCRAAKTKKICTNSHDILSVHNGAILSQNGLRNLDIKELRQLLLQNDPTLLPQVCAFYNKGNGPFGSCNYKQSCNKLHICLQYVLGACPLGSQCWRSHSFLESRSSLENCRLNIELICDLCSIYRNICEIRRREAAADKIKGLSLSRSISEPNTNVDSEEICLFFLRKHCSFKDRCKLVHFRLPYRWQVYEAGWKDLPDMEQIEKDYCNPQFSGRAGPPAINFMTMTNNLNKVRRLSTVSSVTEPQHYTITTEWLWYWQANTGEWIEYGKQEDSNAASLITSADLENLYLANSKEKAEFQIDRHYYTVDFEAMIQRNTLLGTCREVRRRPRFMSKQEMERQMYSNNKIKDEPAQSTAIPTHWEMSAQPTYGYKVKDHQADGTLQFMSHSLFCRRRTEFELVRVLESSEEYKQVQTLFQRTMKNSVIQKIERVQNLALWEVFQWQKEQMKKKNCGKAVDERQLFYGWDSSPISTVLKENFDWRTCGTHGEGYGKGSYLARDASYADNYFSSATAAMKTMFLARVLVGQFFKGKAQYRRPPSKDGSYTNLYDSCTDDGCNPSVFVIFEKHQIYPEYVIEYSNKVGFFQWIMGVMSGKSASAK
ncbi:protein mono-ADP-ribosyltransferase PARP12-like isoform X2 [Rhincodon typus]|uniref:protein mono-ADP-ribosyltransferase PARP12-like isoform X2 n=1 Tax=Rhincodon typus TaxID=259920 RepID=UPI00202F7D15|nr:protein mono-ADP-ribosyltransferase PARP12-like isoform X2 [Rhincodon typus]